jgi:tyrosyl-tRNA synthetase
LEELLKGLIDTINVDDFKQLITSKKKLRIKWGADPSAPDLHLGHTVVLRKLRLFQEMGHEIIFLIGDFTAMIGDPTGKSKTRKPLSVEQVKKNSLSYQEQVFKILDKDQTQVVYNSTWLNKLNAIDIVNLAGKYNVARMLERDDFNKRFTQNISISVHEFLYPLFQGYDSVELKSDIEIGGTDQKFNLLVGRHLQKEYGINPQIVLTMPILEGLDGVQKMSKSLNNHIGITDLPRDMFGKIMSIPDNMISRYYELLTDTPLKDILDIKNQILQQSVNPRDLKIKLAKLITEMYHSKHDALDAENYFITAFSKRDVPEDIPTMNLSEIEEDKTIMNLVKRIEVSSSNKDIKRLFEQGAISLDSQKIMDPFFVVSLEKGEDIVLKIGKRRFVKLIQ